MRSSHAVTALAAFTAGVTAAAALRRRAGTRPPVTSAVPATALPTVPSAPAHDAVVLQFARPLLVGTAPETVQSPARCGDSGGLTKAGTPCGARTAGGGRCHHHPIAAWDQSLSVG